MCGLSALRAKSSAIIARELFIEIHTFAKCLHRREATLILPLERIELIDKELSRVVTKHKIQINLPFAERENRRIYKSLLVE